MKNVQDLAQSNIVANSRPPSEEKWESCRDSEYCLDAAAAMTDMVMSLATEFQQDLDSRQTLDLVVRSTCAFYDGDWCGILSLQNDLDVWTPLHWYNAATGGITDTEHFYEYEVITQYPQWKKAIEERTIICIRNLEQVAATYPMELEHYHRLQVQSVIAVPYYRGSTGFLVIRNLQRYMDYPAFMMHVETVCLLSKLSEVNNHISVKDDMDEMDVTAAESKATYDEVRDWVQDNYGFHFTNLNIAQLKRKYDIIERENYNKPKSDDSRQPGCPEEKVKAIEEAMKHFKMI